MVIQEKTTERITISFSGKVGAAGLSRIKSFIEFLEKNEVVPKRKVSQSQLTKLTDSINKEAWKKFQKAKKLK